MNINDIKAAVDAARERQAHLDDSHSGFENWLIENLKQSDTALIALWDERHSLQWATAEEIAAIPSVVGRRVQIQAVIVEADQRDGLLEVEIDFGRWIVIGNTKVALMQQKEASDATEI